MTILVLFTVPSPLSSMQPHSHSNDVSLPALNTVANFFFFFSHRPCQLGMFYNRALVKVKWITRRAKLLLDRQNSWREQQWSPIRVLRPWLETATERPNGELYQSSLTWRFWVSTVTWEETSLPRPRRSGWGPRRIPPSQTDLHRHAGSEKLWESKQNLQTK